MAIDPNKDISETFSRGSGGTGRNFEGTSGNFLGGDGGGADELGTGGNLEGTSGNFLSGGGEYQAYGVGAFDVDAALEEARATQFDNGGNGGNVLGGNAEGIGL